MMNASNDTLGIPCIKVVAMVDQSTGACCVSQVERQGQSQYAVVRFAKWLDILGHPRVLLQSDGEHASDFFCAAVKRECPSLDVLLRRSPDKSSASLASGGTGSRNRRWYVSMLKVRIGGNVQK